MINKEVCKRCRNESLIPWTDSDEIRWNKQEIIMCKGYNKRSVVEISKDCKHKVEQKLKSDSIKSEICSNFSLHSNSLTEKISIFPSDNKWIIEVKVEGNWIMKESFKTRELARKKSREYEEVTRIRSRA